jgi:alkyl hydroperoxide reductase subunit D
MPSTTAMNLEALREQLHEDAKDLKLNITSVLNSETLTPAQAHGIALCSALYLREEKLRDALLAEIEQAGVDASYVADARAAASIMAMNTIYYRFRHMIQGQSKAYSQKQARLRMGRMARPATSKGDFELMSLAIAALAGCEMCVKSHEQSVLKHGLSDEHVHEAVRIAAAVSGFAVSLHLV